MVSSPVVIVNRTPLAAAKIGDLTALISRQHLARNVWFQNWRNRDNAGKKISPMSIDLSGITVFVTVAETLSFRAAADRLGTSRSAVSQAIRRLEERLRIGLIVRTTRSMRLTEAGERFHAALGPALSDVAAAVDELSGMEGRPRGLLRIAVSSIAEGFLSGQLLAAFLMANPEVKLDVTITDEEFDIVAAGFDAGVRLGEVIEQDMIAVPVSGPQRQIAVAAPAYLERAGTPMHPRELSSHNCIGWRKSPEVAPYRWEFSEGGADFDVNVAPTMTTNDMALMIKMALAGYGVTCGLEETFRDHLGRGELLAILEDFCPPFAGFYLYYPSRRTMPLKLRALVDHLKEAQASIV